MESLGKKALWLVALLAGIFGGAGLPANAAQQEKRPFTVADDIAFTLPGPGYHNVRFSPDGQYFAVYGERGRVDLNKVEDSLRFYRSQDVESFLEHGGAAAPEPVWTVTRYAKEVHPLDSTTGIIHKWRWVADSSGVGFVERTAEGNARLFLADLQKRRVEPLTQETESVGEFDVSDRQHYVYTVPDPEEWAKIQKKENAEGNAAAMVGTGRSLYDMLFPNNPFLKQLSAPLKHLWAVADGRRFEVKHDGAPVVPEGGLALSPDGNSVVTTLSVDKVPASWEALYPPPSASPKDGLHAGKPALQYVRIELKTGAEQALTGAPLGREAGWWWGGFGPPSWSSDGRAVLMPGTFVESKTHSPSRPCVALTDLTTRTTSCVEVLKRRWEETVNGRTEIHRETGYRWIADVRFVGAGADRVGVIFDRPDDSREATQYQRTSGGWEVARQYEGEQDFNREGLEIAIKQSFNQPPLLTASLKGQTRVIWDMNPQLKDIQMGEVSVYKWKDKEGREVKGGLYKPPDYKAGKRYPLVIQTHGFNGYYFFPPGGFTTASAARELAGAGVMVLQSEDRADGCGADISPEEGPCAAETYESAVKQLAADGLVDPERVGIIGFSRSCFYVMEALTTGSLRFKAASVTDGIMFDYFQAMQEPERILGEAIPMIGAAPFGEGLQQWFKKSPGFNFDKINAPLMVVANGLEGLPDMWHPYAELHYLKKPVDLIVLNTDEHVITNPAVRMESQGGSVDWFRFWLQGYEDPDPAKAEQYKRWRGLRELQAESEKKAGSARADSN